MQAECSRTSARHSTTPSRPGESVLGSVVSVCAAIACSLASITLPDCNSLDCMGIASLVYFCLRTSNTNGLSEELRADPNALANGTYDAPCKPYKGRNPEAAPNGPSSSDRPLAGSSIMQIHLRSLVACPCRLPCMSFALHKQESICISLIFVKGLASNVGCYGSAGPGTPACTKHCNTSTCTHQLVSVSYMKMMISALGTLVACFSMCCNFIKDIKSTAQFAYVELVSSSVLSLCHHM